MKAREIRVARRGEATALADGCVFLSGMEKSSSVSAPML